MPESHERRVEQEVSPEQMKQRIENALQMIIERSGTRNKYLILDQIVRELTGCPRIPVESKDVNGGSYTTEELGESAEYQAWVKKYNEGDEGPNTYDWDENIAEG